MLNYILYQYIEFQVLIYLILRVIKRENSIQYKELK
jgi:hypothetical protein